MKIAFVTHFPSDPEAPNGGVESVSVNLVKALANFDDLDIHVITADPDCRLIQRSTWHKVNIHRLPGHQGSMLGFATGKGRQLLCNYLLKLSPDLIHAHDTYGIMIKGLTIPRVFTIHGFIYGDTLISGKNFAWLRSMLWKYFEESAWSDQPNIISISPYVRERLNGIATGTLYDIDNPVSESFFDIKATLETRTIFSAAAICPRKNPMALVEAIAIMKSRGCNAQLRLAGTVSNDTYGFSLHNLIKKHRLEDSVCLLGRLNSHQIQKELAGASVFSLVSLEENSPMGIEEAMAAGIPVVTSNRCGMPYMVRHSDSGFLIDPYDHGEIANRLQLLLENKPLRLEMGQHSRAIAMDRFHPYKVSKRTYDVYREIIAGKNSETTSPKNK